MTRKIVNLMYDRSFKIVFKGESTRFYVKEILETILDIKINPEKIVIKDSEIITSEFTEERGKIVDCYLSYDEKYHVIFEANKCYYPDLYDLKIRYLNAIYNNSYKKNVKSDPDQIFILVNINGFRTKELEGINEYLYKCKEHILTSKCKIINIGLEKIKEKRDNKVTLSKQEKLFLFLKVNHLSDEYVEEVIKGDEVLMTLREEIKKLNNDEILEALFDKDEEEAMELECIKEYERSEGKAEGLKEGEIKGKAEGLKEGKAYNVPYNVPISMDI